MIDAKRAALQVVAAFALPALTVAVAACSGRGMSADPAATEAALVPDPRFNKIRLERDRRLFWNGRPISLAQLSQVLRASSKLDPEPELGFVPAMEADYDFSAKVLNIIKESGVSKFGFIGNAQYSEPDTPDNAR